MKIEKTEKREMENKKIEVSGCIVTYNNSKIIAECIDSLLKWTVNVDFKLFVVDNGSSDNTVEIVKNSFPQVEIIKNKDNRGFGDGHNKVIPLLTSSYHFVINPDIFINHDVISSLVDYMENHKKVAMITPKIMNDTGTEQLLPKRNPTIRYLFFSKLKPFKYYRKIYTRENENLSGPTEIDFCTGCFFGIRTSVFRSVRGFDPRYFMYMEDADLSRTVRKKYKIIFYPDVYVYHKWHRENLRNLKGIKRWFMSMIKYFAKWGLSF